MVRRTISAAEFYALRDMRRAGVRPRDLALATGRRQNSVSRLTRRDLPPNSDTVSSSLGVGDYPPRPILLPGLAVPLPAARAPQSKPRRRSFHSDDATHLRYLALGIAAVIDNVAGELL